MMLGRSWLNVPFGEVIKHRKEFIQIDDLTAYKRCRVQLHAQGIVLRDSVSGSEIKTKKQQICHAGEFLVAEIDAKVGGFGIVPESLEGAIVSSHYFLFKLDEKLLDRRFLDYFIRTRHFRDQVTAQGSTNYAAIRPDDVLGYMISLPPLEEQRRIVARIEELAARIEEARELRRRAVEETNAFSESLYGFIFNYKINPIFTIEELVGRKNLKNGLSVKATSFESAVKCLRLSALRNGKIDCLDSKSIPMNENEIVQYLVKDKDVFIMRGNGSKDLVGRAGIVEKTLPNIIFPDLFIQVPLDNRIILPEFFVAWWNSRIMRNTIEEAAKTTSGIWKINQGHIASFSIPVPGLDEQNRLIAYLDGMQFKLDALKRLQAQTAAELDSLLPAILERAFRSEL